jgi:hypothetical protein
LRMEELWLDRIRNQHPGVRFRPMRGDWPFIIVESVDQISNTVPKRQIVRKDTVDAIVERETNGELPGCGLHRKLRGWTGFGARAAYRGEEAPLPPTHDAWRFEVLTGISSFTPTILDMIYAQLDIARWTTRRIIEKYPDSPAESARYHAP